MTDRLRIAIASWAPFQAGAEIAAERLGLGLREAGHEVLMVLGTDGETLRRMREVGLRCEFVPLMLTDKWRMWHWRAVQQQLRHVLRRFNPNILHCNDLPTSQMVGQSAQRLGIPRVCHHRFLFENAAIDWLNKFGAERHLFVSQAFMREMCARSTKLAHAPRSVVHDGMPLPPQPTFERRRNVRQILRLPADRVLVLFAGQIAEHKGLADLLNAWKQMSANAHAKAELIVVGEDLRTNGRYRTAMQELAGAIGCPARFTGFQADIGAWQLAADIAVVPSRIEPLGLVVMEAMAQELPVVGCHIGGIPEMIVHEQTGLLVPPNDPAQLAVAIERLINRPDERRRFGEAGRIRCEQHFSISVHTTSIFDEYRKAMSSELVGAGA